MLPLVKCTPFYQCNVPGQVVANLDDVLVVEEAWEGIHVPSFSERGPRWC